ncbi:MAG: hypothetical protein MI864_14970 [Pseudomonadales bacterium]|nr:hypothetical protein [Pseudomonadales bacterium]
MNNVSRFHCSADSLGSYVDLLTNSVVLTEIELDKHLSQILRLRVPELVLPNFLHESMHFWCFQSPVGNALALLRLRALRKAAAIDRNDSDACFDLLEDVMRYETCMELLRPLAEGLACFAEFDSTPGTSNVLSGPMLWAYTLFEGGGTEYRDRGPNVFLYELLSRMRNSHVGIDRKVNLFASDLDFESGHLAGYLTIKMLRNFALTVADRANDSDHYMSFLKSYFYDDYGFVAVILDPNVKEHVAGQNIGEYFQQRIAQLMTMDLDAAMGEYEADINQKPIERVSKQGISVSLPVFSGLRGDDDTTKTGMNRLVELTGELHNETSRAGGAEVYLDQKILVQRSSLCLGHAACWVRINEYGHVMIYRDHPSNWEEGFLGAHQAIDNTQPYEGFGRIEVRYQPVDYNLSYYVWNDKDLIAQIAFTGKAAESTPPQPIDRQTLLDYIAQREERLREMIEEDDTMSLIIQEMTSPRKDGITDFYLRIISQLSPGNSWKKTVKTLQNGGLCQLLDNNLDLVQSLAIASNATNQNYDETGIKHLFQDHGLDYDDFLEGIKAVERKHGVNLYIREDDLVFTTI